MIHFDREVSPADDIVVLRVLTADTLADSSSRFQLGKDVLKDLRVGFYQVLKLGREAQERTGLQPGSYVYADSLASFYHTEPIAMMRWNAIILETNRERTELRALAGRALVQPVKEDEKKASGLFAIPTSDELRIGVVKSITPPWRKDGEGREFQPELPFKVGDKVLLTKEERDTLQGFGGSTTIDPTLPIHVYRTESIVCRIED